MKTHLLLAALVVTACASSSSPASASPAAPDAFERFIATHPTPASFHQAYPRVLLVLPGEVTTEEMRIDHSRYIATVDADGNITGGSFH